MQIELFQVRYPRAIPTISQLLNAIGRYLEHEHTDAWRDVCDGDQLASVGTGVLLEELAQE